MKMSRCIVFTGMLVLLSAVQTQAEEYTTWENMEIDKCASTWLIKRFVDQEAVFRFVPKGELITHGIPFDTPEAQIRRYHNLSAFEYIVKTYKLNDPAIQKIAQIIHDIEINYWGAKKRPESQKINHAFRKIVESAQTPDQCLQQGFAFFDQLYARLE